MRALVLSLVAVTVACAAPAQHTTERIHRPMVASMEPVAPPAPEPYAEDLPPDASAGVFLEHAFGAFRNDNHDRASNLFHAAIRTGDLNEAGRALAYWHIHLSEQQERHEDKSLEAASSFVIVAEDILEQHETMAYGIDLHGDFVERFQLPRRLAQARALISATWSVRVPQFGRSVDNPVPVQSPVEAAYFLSFTSDCESEAQKADSERSRAAVGDRLERVTLRCGNSEPTSFYFQYAAAE